MASQKRITAFFKRKLPDDDEPAAGKGAPVSQDNARVVKRAMKSAARLESSDKLPDHALVRLVPETWAPVLAPHMCSPSFVALLAFLDRESAQGKTIYPPAPLVFSALSVVPLSNCKVVILGQDPYHQPRQAHGMSFSVPPGVPPPPSLMNITKELHDDMGYAEHERARHGSLVKWASQGVLLLNAVLTVEASKPNSHTGKGWEEFTDAIIDAVNVHSDHVVFLLWGAYAKKKGSRIDRSKHTVLESAHPSPLSANRGGWFGCKHFSKTNDALPKGRGHHCGLRAANLEMSSRGQAGPQSSLHTFTLNFMKYKLFRVEYWSCREPVESTGDRGRLPPWITVCLPPACSHTWRRVRMRMRERHVRFGDSWTPSDCPVRASMYASLSRLSFSLLGLYKP
ncbi:Uracil-DNA glycosylase [Porphyridium purpureum]|uniref:Uracil-DNA glycosylase n=1 Tax=Porphyridium purpureum TaxID=35688 RepID=A0A5J4Z558_PORPP|nr:Uracil-DNA glycosylase [Porphyridium purpureum]|eukprot:POR7361..scf295_1